MEPRSVAVNTRLLLPQKMEGIGRFTHEIFQRLVKCHPETQFFFLFDRKPDPGFLYADNVTPVVLPPQARHPLLFLAWFEGSVKWWLRRRRPDLFLSPDGFLSLGSATPSLAIIHDLNFEHMPEYLPRNVRKFYRRYFPRYARKATRLGTVSAFSQNDIHEQYGIPKERIDIIPNGVSADFYPDPSPQACEIIGALGVEQPYFLYVGSINPRKNLLRLLDAFEQFNRQGYNHQLVVVGTAMWSDTELEHWCRHASQRQKLVVTGRLKNDQLRAVYSHANALVMPSLFEGFGIPLIEAMQCGCPVISSNRTSLPEVAGDAALYFDPLQTGELVAQMIKLEKNTALRNELVKKGTQRSEMFTWDRAADAMWNSIVTTWKNSL